jgi:putative membrane protein
MKLILHWLLSAACIVVVAYFVPGIKVSGITAALIAAVVVGLVNATVGVLLKAITLPLRWLTLGLFSLVINALMLMLAAALVPGFTVSGFVPAFLGAILLAVLHWLIDQFMSDNKKS